MDWALADLVISEREQGRLERLAADLGLSGEDVAAAHRRYIDELVAAAVRDDIVTDEEDGLLHRAAEALNVDPAVVDGATAAWRPDTGGVRLEAGMTVCFTGSATYPDGSKLPRSRLEEIAGDLGLDPVGSVTKKGCDLLVAADTSTQSTKAAKARRYGTPLVDVRDFLKAQAGATIPAIRT